MISRRDLIRYSSASVAASLIPHSHASQGRVVVIGGGFAGASVARELRRLNNALSVSLIEANATYTACPLSNMVIAGHREITQQQFSYAALSADGITVIHHRAMSVDPERRVVELSSGKKLGYDKLILAPGIDLDWQALQGYDETAAELLPHAWKAGAQTTLLRDQLRDMRKGGLVVMSVPKSPYRCPPGPYERASLIAGYLKQNNPRAKVLILDSKDSFSKKPLFMSAWKSLYGDIIEWQGESDGATVTAVNADNRSVSTDFETVQADVANIIPPQRAGKIAHLAGVTDRSGWCPIEPVTFSSALQPDIHVIGDAAIANAMPKSAFAANAQAKLCAVQVTRLLNGESPVSGKLINTC